MRLTSGAPRPGPIWGCSLILLSACSGCMPNGSEALKGNSLTIIVGRRDGHPTLKVGSVLLEFESRLSGGRTFTPIGELVVRVTLPE